MEHDRVADAIRRDVQAGQAHGEEGLGAATSENLKDESLMPGFWANRRALDSDPLGQAREETPMSLRIVFGLDFKVVLERRRYLIV